MTIRVYQNVLGSGGTHSAPQACIARCLFDNEHSDSIEGVFDKMGPFSCILIGLFQEHGFLDREDSHSWCKNLVGRVDELSYEEFEKKKKPEEITESIGRGKLSKFITESVSKVTQSSNEENRKKVVEDTFSALSGELKKILV